jgi:hypothetical protein
MNILNLWKHGGSSQIISVRGASLNQIVFLKFVFFKESRHWFNFEKEQNIKYLRIFLRIDLLFSAVLNEIIFRKWFRTWVQREYAIRREQGNSMESRTSRSALCWWRSFLRHKCKTINKYKEALSGACSEHTNILSRLIATRQDKATI